MPRRPTLRRRQNRERRWYLRGWEERTARRCEPYETLPARPDALPAFAGSACLRLKFAVQTAAASAETPASWRPIHLLRRKPALREIRWGTAACRSRGRKQIQHRLS